MNEPQKAILAVQIKPELRREIKARAVLRGKTLQQFVTEILETYIKQENRRIG